MLRQRRLLIREPILLALHTLREHKLRSFLTLFGVIIAVTTLIGVISIVEGMNAYFAERVANMGTNVFYVSRYPIITNLKDLVEARRRNPQMTIRDYQYMRDHMTLAELVGAREFRRANLRAGKQSILGVSLRGVTPNFIEISPETVGHGRYFTPTEYQRKAQVAFLGTDVLERLFLHVDPVGKQLLIDGKPFEVIGVAEKVGSAFGQSRDNFVYIPLTTLYKSWGQAGVNSRGVRIAIKCASPAVMEQAKEEARTLMRARRRQRPDEKDVFGMVESQSLTALWDRLVGGLATGAILIVSVFLVVGGIVIMNIMLASVTERTREIGVRKAIGARRRDILLQFLVEAAIISTVGGVLGVLLALGISQLVAVTIALPMRTPLWAVGLAVSVSAAIGLFFGVYPAHKAARYDPVVALRAE
ncbi:MAG: ABC transporter permease [Terriglobia bacterium]